MQPNQRFMISSKDAETTGNLFFSQQSHINHKVTDQQVNQPTETVSAADGEWRSNKLMGFINVRTGYSDLTLRHLTSFQERSMETHGQVLGYTLRNYLNTYNQSWNPEEQQSQFMIKFTNWDDVEDAISNLQFLEQIVKNSLIKFCKKNIAAQITLRLIFTQIPSEYQRQSLVITEKIFEYYQNDRIELKDQDEIETYVYLNFTQVADQLRIRLRSSQISPNNEEGVFKFESMVRIWMQTIFLALNGVFENPEDRRTPIHELLNWQSCYSSSSRKIIRID